MMRFIKDTIKAIGDFIINTFKMQGADNRVVGCIVVGVIGLIVLGLIIFIIIKVTKGKKKVAAKEEPKEVETKEEPAPEVQEEPVEEKVEEAPAQEEPAPVEELKEEPAPEVKEEPVEEKVEEAKAEAIEEAKVEEEVVEETIPEAAPNQDEVQEETIILPEEDQKELEEALSEVEEVPAQEEKVEEVKEEPVQEKPVKKAAPKKAPAKKEPTKVEEPAAPVKEAKGKFVLVQEGPNWRYKLKASNGEVLIVSEPYTSEKAVRTGIETLKKNLELSRCDFVEDKHGLFSFRVMTKQGRCLATSANYKTKARATSASESYKRWALSENIVVDEEGGGDHSEVEKVEVKIEEENTGTYLVKEVEGGFIYQLVAANKRVIATSQVYKSKSTCIDAIENFRVVVYEGSFYIYRDKNDKFQFKLYNKQNRLVLAGEVYDDKARVKSVIEAISRLAHYAKVEEVKKED